MEEESWRRNHERGIVEGEACKRNHGRGMMKEETSGSIRSFLGDIWEASGRHLGVSRRRHLEASGAIWEASGRHLGGTWEASGAPRASGGIVGAL